MTTDKRQAAIDALDALDAADPEAAHAQADDILLAYVHPSVQAAYDRLVDRAAWWATA